MHADAEETLEKQNMSLKGRNFLKLLDFTPERSMELLDLAAELKAKKKPVSSPDV